MDDMDAESGPKVSASKGSMTDFSENCAGASCSLQSASATQDKVADEAQATEPEDAFADEAGNTKLHVCDCVELALEPPEQKEGAPQQGGDAELGPADTFHEDAACATAADQPKIEIDKGMVRGILLLRARNCCKRCDDLCAHSPSSSSPGFCPFSSRSSCTACHQHRRE